jgi:hypothetical protein
MAKSLIGWSTSRTSNTDDDFQLIITFNRLRFAGFPFPCILRVRQQGIESGFWALWNHPERVKRSGAQEKPHSPAAAIPDHNPGTTLLRILESSNGTGMRHLRQRSAVWQ